jgi:hypothetical protein
MWHCAFVQLPNVMDNSVPGWRQTCAWIVTHNLRPRLDRAPALRALVETISSTPRVFLSGGCQARCAGNSGTITKQRNAAAARQAQPNVEIISTRVLDVATRPSGQRDRVFTSCLHKLEKELCKVLSCTIGPASTN